MLKLFQSKNKKVTSVQDFSITAFEQPIQEVYEQIQAVFKRKFLQVQELCIRYVMANLDKRMYINFGMGNGKTLLCTALAILLATRTNSPVYIFTKGAYLAYRDHLKFSKLIKECGIPIAALNEPISSGISFINEKSLQYINQSRPDSLSKSYLIDDEYDKDLFGDGSKGLNLKLKALSLPIAVIAFTGSRLSDPERRLLKQELEIVEVAFPQLSELETVRVVHHQDLIVGSNLADCIIEKITEVCIDVPVIVVGQKNEMDMLEKKLSKMQEPKPVCYNLAKMMSGSKPKLALVHNIIE